jgi:hypothetical protein
MPANPTNRCMTMKTLVLSAAIVTAAALVTVPADAASKKRKKVTASNPSVTTSYARRDSNTVYNSDGTIIGTDPDPFIRAMMRRSPKPWLGRD